ncbi:DNA repair protein RadC [Enterobacter kobei]|uniref:RadC family protein n=1 Tax=Enterobacter kobei TaxID=208224 RepID=UPI000B3D0925|nr:DNA repair protein RadC [Enterobacter kobei]MBT1799029.1 DNA repair protein RadC [Enterobacter kobei]MBW7696501.1 DNA repair protein RadC [Enterobacter kobei]MBW7772845.1 DNA repair protein RadC [Enterobacter kobei]MCK6863571.1 DNA repair protein RadC [Enterobacter kobei]MCO7419198.1 DNA repair protein RadC [Enterobacter kobei]
MHDEIINQAREILTQRLYRTDALTSPQDTASYLALQPGDQEQEVFSVIFLDNQNHVLRYQEMFHGNIATTTVYPREIARLALKLNAAAIICSHNHPSGNAKPSTQDKSLTLGIQKVMELIEVRLVDHIVVGGGQTVSFAERGWL